MRLGVDPVMGAAWVATPPIRKRIARIESHMLVCAERGRWHPIELSDRCIERFRRGG